MRRYVYLCLGWIAVALGFVGIALPMLPTTPFLLLAAFLFGKGSPRARAWLIDHPRLGPPIRHWEANGAISRRAKIAAAVAMAAAFGLGVALGLPPLALTLQGLCLAGAATFVLTRPD
ncbi:DUF454 domain-containing protein [Mesobaculum littorinae]|uniref:DUF454 domain-containing protein n=1 Tax=Mesobaculum littorinae TaxID=2486419 RepID=A0A438AIS0_9RHOB|nr:YbaN family protein [Mesobaculum littorinae]RVV98600.1 DUF454 domain-containing protein [Mesobaculum littorinae]